MWMLIRGSVLPMCCYVALKMLLLVQGGLALVALHWTLALSALRQQVILVWLLGKG